MKLNKNGLDVILYVARLLGILPYKWTKTTTENMSFQSVLTSGYITKRLLAASVILILHIKFRIYDKISSETNFQMLVYIGSSTTTLLFAIAIVLVSTAFYGKKVVKLTTFFPKKCSSVNLDSDKKFLSESFLFFAQAVYIAAVAIVIIVSGLFEYKSWQFLPNVCIDLYTEWITHIWTIAYFNHLLRLRAAFEDLYSACTNIQGVP